MTEPEENSKRPSFASFWKRGKERLKGKDVTFVKKEGSQQGSESSQSPESSGKSPETPPQQLSQADKAKIRRAQVRKAQIQHRQRKAEYVKQLELDASHYRDLVSLTEAEKEALMRENEAMRVMLQSVGLTAGAVEFAPEDVPMTGFSPTSFDQILHTPLIDEDPPELFADINIDDIIITLRDDDVLGTPVFQISPGSGSYSHASPASGSEAEKTLSPEQEHAAINFILSLEHTCWDHFFLGDFLGHSHESNVAMGHSMMASTMCMANAPEQAFLGRTATPKGVQCSKTYLPKGTPVDCQWTAPGISLQSLFGLASSLIPGDKELTPVQAWFELARRYPIEKLTDAVALEALKVQLNGVVKCLRFGAVIEREAFESVVDRVLGPASVDGRY